ncbi:efflux RND transporter periplasmic adaptor subunit [Candidatus Woesebacteria bacterium]|nr:efflux RND transporter periplasmic adaptor subunit [Candidatus Woesebacteria bacterium]
MQKVKKQASGVWNILKKRWYLIFIIIAIGGFLLYRYNKQKTQAQERKRYTVTREDLKETLALSGAIDAEEHVLLHFQTAGRLSWVGVKEGDTVKQYQGIASLDQRQLQKTLEKYLNTYEKNRYTFEQTNDDNQDDIVDLSKEVRTEAERVLKQSQLDLNNTVLDVELQSIAKEYSYLYTPIAGVVTRADADVAGVNVSVTDMYEVVNPDTIDFSLSADQTEVVDLVEGQTGSITLDAFPDQSFTGTIAKIGFAPRTDETGTVYDVRMDLDGADVSQLRLGMTGDVEFVIGDAPNSLFVPFEYLIEENDKDYVMLEKQDGTLEKTVITVGKEYDQGIEVTSGLSEGDVIVEPES